MNWRKGETSRFLKIRNLQKVVDKAVFFVYIKLSARVIASPEPYGSGRGKLILTESH